MQPQASKSKYSYLHHIPSRLASLLDLEVPLAFHSIANKVDCVKRHPGPVCTKHWYILGVCSELQVSLCRARGTRSGTLVRAHVS